MAYCPRTLGGAYYGHINRDAIHNYREPASQFPIKLVCYQPEKKMTISMYSASVPVYQSMLSNLKGVLAKGAAFAAAKKVDESVLMNARLAPDMLAMSRQVQIACDFAKGSIARLAGLEVPKWEDNEKSFADLAARIDKTIAYIGEFSAAQIEGQEDRNIELTIAGNPMSFKGQHYLLNVAMPNFYFHTTTAYAILRHNGVEIGKGDFLGRA
jgi:hypothetical protein